MRRLRFAKMSGAGNDFILIDARQLPRRVRPAGLARRLCRRRDAVGADGLLVAKRSPRSFEYYNADGSTAWCGNGARCAAWWMVLRGWAGRRFRLGSPAGEVEARVTGREKVRLSLPRPKLLAGRMRVRAAGRSFVLGRADTGVPHAVIRVGGASLDRIPLERWGRALRRHPSFGRKGTNADFITLDRRGLRIRTYERGVEAETASCGSGAAAAALLVSLWTGRRPPITVRARGGTLRVGFRKGSYGTFEDLWLEGPARAIYEGEVLL